MNSLVGGRVPARAEQLVERHRVRERDRPGRARRAPPSRPPARGRPGRSARRGRHRPHAAAAPVLGRGVDRRRRRRPHRRYANSGRRACSSASEWRAVPPVAAMSTGLPARPSRSMTSKNILNRPLYEALKIGVTAIRPSAARTASIAACSRGAREAGQQVVRQVLGVVAQLDHLDLRGRCPRRADGDPSRPKGGRPAAGSTTAGSARR